MPSARRRAAAPPLALAAALGCTLVAAAPRAEQPPRHAYWPGNNALTIAPGRWVLGATSQSSWAVHQRAELRAHVIVFFALPHVEGKLRWLDAGPWQLSTRHRVAYPTPFLSLVAREGSGGLLPPTEDVAHALILDQGVLASRALGGAHWLTAEVALAVGVGSRDGTLLDFPFLYQRFAPLNAPVVPRFELKLDGDLATLASYELELRHDVLPLDDFPIFQATELAGTVYLWLGERQRIGGGMRISRAELPIGYRTHFLPFVDYQLGF